MSVKVLGLAACFLSLKIEHVSEGVQASVCVLARSQSPANNVSMVARSSCLVWREMCNLTHPSHTILAVLASSAVLSHNKIKK